MRFANSNFIYSGILLALAVVIFYFWAEKKKQVLLGKFAQKELLNDLLSSVDLRLQRLKVLLLISGIILCLFALMRPQWGFQWREVKRRGLDIIIAIDTSRSMLAEDVLPSRIERSKLTVKDFIRNLKGDRVGLIAFSGTAFLQCPLTIDYSGFLVSLDDVSVNTIPRGGTSLAACIKEAVRSYPPGQKKYKVLVVITDGEDHEGNLDEAIKEAKKENINIFCIGIGTKEGELVFTEEEGKKGYLKDDSGNAVKSRLNEGVLQKISVETAGSYVRASATEFGLELLYKERLSKMEKRELEGRMSKQYEERFQWVLAVAIFIFVAELLINDRKRV